MKWIKRIGFFLLVLLALLGAGGLFTKYSFMGKALGVLEINGTFLVADEWIKKIEKFRKDPSIAGVIVRINSPGGSVAASQEIYASLKKLSGAKPVVASMGSVAASGGLYVALAANRILAEAGTLTGSIGVRMEHVNIGELLNIAKIKYETIKSGALKDIGSPVRSLTEEERLFLDDLMQEIHLQFKKVVAEARSLTMEEVDKIADGRIFTGEKALDLKMIDEVGGFGKSVEVASRLAGIEGEPRLIYCGDSPFGRLKFFLGHLKAYLSGPQIGYFY